MRSRFMMLLAIAFVGGVGGAQAPANPNTASTSGRTEIRLMYLGNAGREITDGKTYVLTDPFITQFRSNREAKPGQVEPPPMPSPEETLTPDTEGIDGKIHRGDYILITHGHRDHAPDAPYIAKKIGSTIIGRETVANIARAYDGNSLGGLSFLTSSSILNLAWRRPAIKCSINSASHQLPSSSRQTTGKSGLILNS